MARDISIAVSARDNFTQVITTMRNANKSFNKDLTGLQSKLDVLNKNKITLKIDTQANKHHKAMIWEEYTNKYDELVNSMQKAGLDPEILVDLMRSARKFEINFK